MKKIFHIFLAIIIVFSMVSCTSNDTINLAPNSSKPMPSTVLSVKMPKRSPKKDLIVITVGMGKGFYAKYNNYIETIFSIDAQGVIINSCNDHYSQTFDITEEQYLCTKNGKIQYYVEIPLDFSNCEQTSGTIVISLTSYFPGNETDGSRFHIDYTIEDKYVRFSNDTNNGRNNEIKKVFPIFFAIILVFCMFFCTSKKIQLT